MWTWNCGRLCPWFCPVPLLTQFRQNSKALKTLVGAENEVWYGFLWISHFVCCRIWIICTFPSENWRKWRYWQHPRAKSKKQSMVKLWCFWSFFDSKPKAQKKTGWENHGKSMVSGNFRFSFFNDALRSPTKIMCFRIRKIHRKSSKINENHVFSNLKRIHWCPHRGP